MFDKNLVFRIHKELLKLSKKNKNKKRQVTQLKNVQRIYYFKYIYICHIYWNLLHESHPCHGKEACVTQ